MNSTDAQYGSLYTCPRCEGIYFLGFDGLPETNSIENSAENAVSSEIISPTTESEPRENEHNFTNFLPADNQVPGLDVPPLPNLNQNIESAPFENFEVQQLQEQSPQQSLQEIVDYGNSDQFVSGPLSYDLLIEGIDLADLKKKLLEALDDKRLGFDQNSIAKKIKLGQLKLKSLSPVQASIIVNRIKFFGLKISWYQKLLDVERNSENET